VGQPVQVQVLLCAPTKTPSAQMTAENKAARTGFIHQAQLHILRGELFDQFILGTESSADDAVAAHFGGVLRRDGYGDRIFVDVQANVMHDFIHGWLVSLHGY
jgi:hypothetical protein